MFSAFSITMYSIKYVTNIILKKCMYEQQINRRTGDDQDHRKFKIILC